MQDFDADITYDDLLDDAAGVEPAPPATFAELLANGLPTSADVGALAALVLRLPDPGNRHAAARRSLLELLRASPLA